MQTASNQYSECLDGVSSATPGLLLGGVACCGDQYVIGLCACPPPSVPPGPGPVPGGGNKCGDPVDAGSGIFTYQNADLELDGLIPIRLAHVYREFDSGVRTFGVGMASNYDLQILVDESGNYAWADLVLPDGGRIHYVRTTPGAALLGAVFQNTSSPTIYYSSAISWNNNEWILALKDGTKLGFSISWLVSITDRNGNQLDIQRDVNGNATGIRSPSGRWINFTLDPNNRISRAQDNTGRTVYYVYGSSGHLREFYDANGGLTAYAYDSAGRMTSFTTPDGNVHANNQYDANGRVVQQAQPDGGVFHFNYTLDGSGNVIATDMVDPRGSACHMAFNSNGYLTSDTWAAGAPEQETTSYARDGSSNLVTSTTDQLSRVTAYTYDSLGNVTSVQRLANTTPVTTYFTYDPTYSELTSVKDPLGHVWSLTVDSNTGNVTAFTDPLSHQITASYSAQGQLSSLADAAGDTAAFAYSPNGDLASVTDPMEDDELRI